MEFRHPRADDTIGPLKYVADEGTGPWSYGGGKISCHGNAAELPQNYRLASQEIPSRTRPGKARSRIIR